MPLVSYQRCTPTVHRYKLSWLLKKEESWIMLIQFSYFITDWIDRCVYHLPVFYIYTIFLDVNIFAKDASPLVMSDVLCSYFTFPFVYRLFLNTGYFSRFHFRILVLSWQLYCPLLLSAILFLMYLLSSIKKNYKNRIRTRISIYGKNTKAFKNKEQI